VFVRDGVTERDVWQAYRKAWGSEPFVRLVKERTGIYRVPEPKILAGSNFADVGFELEEDGGRVVAICAVDNLIHCSRHLRRSDASGRILCETHRDTCAEEPGAVLATDEVFPCASCGSHVCHRHSATCNEEMADERHCHRHMAPLADRGGAPVCGADEERGGAGRHRRLVGDRAALPGDFDGSHPRNDTDGAL